MKGNVALTRFILRLDRLRLTVWLLVISLMTMAVGSSWDRLYPTADQRLELAKVLASNPAISALLGELHNPQSSGALTAWRIGVGLVLSLGLVWAFTVTRHLRAEEEAGRRELLLAAPLDRPAPVRALITVTGLGSIGFVALASVGLLALGFDLTGTLLFTGSVALCGLAIAGLAALLNQLARTARAANALTTVIVVATWVLAIVGNLQGSWLVRTSPFGWVNQAQAYADNRWWVAAVPLVAALVTWAVALRVAGNRDLGEAMFGERAGPARGSRRLRNSAGLAWRLDGASVFTWAIGIAVVGIFIGLSRNAIVDFLASSEFLSRAINALGGSQLFVNSFLGAYISIGALAVGFFVVSMVLRIHKEEMDGRASMLLSTSTGRSRWASSHVVVAVTGSIVIMLVLGVAMGVSVGLVGGSGLTEVPKVVVAALGAVPALLFITGLTLLIVGVLPRMAYVAWAMMAGFAILSELGAVVGLPSWMQNLSPFTHAQLVPGNSPWSVAALVLIVAALVAGAIGLRVLNLRDIA